MKKIQLLFCFCLISGMLFSQNNESDISQIGIDQLAEVIQKGALNQVLVRQVSEQPQFAWVFQSGEMTDETSGTVIPGGEDNRATVDQTYLGKNNLTFLFQYGSHNRSLQRQNGSNNQFNTIKALDDPDLVNPVGFLPTMEATPNQDGDYHELSQIANGNNNQAWVYQAGREHNASQLLNGNENQVWTSQSGLNQKSEMIINGNRNGSHYMLHEEGKFPHSEEDDEEGGPGASVGGNGNHGDGSGGQGEDGGMPGTIPPPHEEDHVFVSTVGVAIKQMGSNSTAEMYIEGDDNKAIIAQRGGAGATENGNGGCEGGHYVSQDVYGDWNRVFADQRGTGHDIYEYVNGDHNLVVLIQKGNGSDSDLTLNGNFNEIGVDQKGKNNISDIDVRGNFNGNFLAGDEFGIKVVQEGKGNNSDIDIIGDSNFIAVHQGGGAISIITQTGNLNSTIVNQSTIDEH